MGKTKRIWRLARIGRPKTGRNYFSRSLSFTLRQNKFLDERENASEFLRKILDEMISLQEDLEPKLTVVALHHEIEILEVQLHNLRGERQDYLEEEVHGKRRYKEMYEYVEREGDLPLEIRSEATPKARYYWKIANGMDDGIRAVEKKIAELKDKIMAS